MKEAEKQQIIYKSKKLIKRNAINYLPNILFFFVVIVSIILYYFVDSYRPYLLPLMGITLLIRLFIWNNKR